MILINSQYVNTRHANKQLVKSENCYLAGAVSPLGDWVTHHQSVKGRDLFCSFTFNQCYACFHSLMFVPPLEI